MSAINRIAEKKWFVPFIIFIFVILLVFSLSDKRVENNDLSIESSLEDICNSVSGVKNAKVMITYESIEASTFMSNAENKRIQGVVVVCDGGDNPDIQLRLQEIIRSLFGISSTRITISERNKY